VIDGKPPVSLLTEWVAKAMSSAVEIVTTTEEDAVNPFLTTVLVEGIVVARGASNNKKSSRQVAARQARIRVRSPLL